jgi:hypothetical protein
MNNGPVPLVTLNGAATGLAGHRRQSGGCSGCRYRRVPLAAFRACYEPVMVCVGLTL